MENTANLLLVIKRKFHVNFCSVVLFGCVWQRLQIYRNDTSESRLCVKNRIVFSPTTKFSVCLCLMCVESVYKIYTQKICQTTTSTPEKHGKARTKVSTTPNFMNKVLNWQRRSARLWSIFSCLYARTANNHNAIKWKILERKKCEMLFWILI